MYNHRMLTPGPTRIPQRIFSAMNQPQIHHRTPEFKAIFQATAAGYQSLVDSPTPPVFLACSGTGAMEAIVTNLTGEGDSVLVIRAGKFGQRWSDLGAKYGLRVHEVVADWGNSIDLSQLEETLKAAPEISAVMVQHCETSTSVLHPIAAIQRLVDLHVPEALLLVDGITSIGVHEVSMKHLKLDGLACGSQKALMLPPGLSMITMSERAWERRSKNTRSVHYFDLSKEYSLQSEGSTSWTPAIGLVLGLREALHLIEEEGSSELYARHRHMSAMARAGMSALGLALLAEGCESHGLTAAYLPKEIPAGPFLQECLNRFNLRMAGGQDHLKGAIFRLGHMGAVDQFDVISALAAIGAVLHASGHKVEPEAGVVAATRLL